MRYVEHKGDLFRIKSTSHTCSIEVWSAREASFVPYQGDTPIPAGCGKVMTHEEAEAYMRDTQQLVGSIPHRLLDGYDGGTSPSPEYMEGLLKDAPPWIRDRLDEVAREKSANKDKK